MSEFHPNRTTPVRTKPKLTTRRILECWPLLIWVAMGTLAIWVYKSGVTFNRMNGAVDVYQENVTPIEEGRLKEIKVKRGQQVTPGTVVAVMDPAPHLLEMETLKRQIVADREKDIRDYDLELIKLDAELREIETSVAEDEAAKRELSKVLAGMSAPAAIKDPALRAIVNAQTDSVRNQVDLAKAEGRLTFNDKHLGSINAAIKRVSEIRETLTKQAEAVAKLNLSSEEVAKSNLLNAEEQQQYIEIRTKIDQCELKASHGGIVDRVDKEVGEYVNVGEGVLKIVGEPQQIICFLPQDQANQLWVDKEVWVTATNQPDHAYKTVVEAISPRINNLADATSPLPNQRIHGRDIVVKYPPEAMPGEGKAYALLPGQTVVIHTEKPGNVPLLNRIFPSDDTVR